MAKLWFCWIFFVLFLNILILGKEIEENLNILEVSNDPEAIIVESAEFDVEWQNLLGPNLPETTSSEPDKITIIKEIDSNEKSAEIEPDDFDTEWTSENLETIISQTTANSTDSMNETNTIKTLKSNNAQNSNWLIQFLNRSTTNSSAEEIHKDFNETEESSREDIVLIFEEEEEEEIIESNNNETKTDDFEESLNGTGDNTLENSEKNGNNMESSLEKDENDQVYAHSQPLDYNAEVETYVSPLTFDVNITDESQNDTENTESTKFETVNNETFVLEIQNETKADLIFEGSASFEKEIDGSGSGNDQMESIDDENGDDDFESEVDLSYIEFNFKSEDTTTTSTPSKMIEMHKCYCSEVKECLQESWRNDMENTEDENLLTKCSMTFLKNDCSIGWNTVTKVFDANKIHENETSNSCQCKENSKQQLFANQMQKCFIRKSCFLQDFDTLMSKTYPFCIAKVKKLSVLNALKLSKDEILALKNEYVNIFDEQFEDGKNTHYSNIFSRWFYRLRNKFCDTF